MSREPPRKYQTFWLLFGLLILLTCVVLVWAGSVSAVVTWSAPATYIDGTPLPAGDIDHYTVSWSPSGGTAGVLAVKTLSASIPVVCGTVHVSVSATTTATAVYPNVTSEPAGPVPFVSAVQCAPNPPGALAVHP